MPENKEQDPKQEENLHITKLTILMSDGTERVVTPTEGDKGVGVIVITATPDPNDHSVDIEAYTHATPPQIAMGIATIFHRDKSLLPRVLNGMAREKDSELTIVRLPLPGFPGFTRPPEGKPH